MKSAVRVLAVLLAFALAVSCLPGCGRKASAPAEPAGPKVLRLNLGEEPPDLDPGTSHDSVSFQVLNNVLEGLVRIGPGEKVEKGSGLALDWTGSSDGRRYVFTLREAKWSDGVPVKAQDFEYAWKRVLDPRTGSPYAYIMYTINGAKALNSTDPKAPASEIEAKMAAVGVRATGDRTLEVVLEQPVPYFLGLLAFPTFFPVRRDVVEKHGDAFASEPDQMVYCGPFVIREWQHEAKMVLERNSSYWDAGNISLDRVEFAMVKDQNAAVNMFEAGDLDSVMLPGEFLDKYRERGMLKPAPLAAVWYLMYNLGNPLFQRTEARLAFSLAVDRRQLTEAVLRNGSLPATSLTPSAVPGPGGRPFAEAVGKLFPESADPAAAREALTRSGFSAGRKVVLLTSDTALQKKVAAALQEMWRKNLGVEVEVQSVAFKIWIDRMTKGDFDLCLGGWGADYNDPMTFLDLWVTGGPNNGGGYSNAEYDRLVEEASSCLDEGKRFGLLAECEKLIARDLPVAPLWWPVRNFAEKPGVEGIVRHPVGADLELKWAKVR